MASRKYVGHFEQGYAKRKALYKFVQLCGVFWKLDRKKADHCLLFIKYIKYDWAYLVLLPGLLIVVGVLLAATCLAAAASASCLASWLWSESEYT